MDNSKVVEKVKELLVHAKERKFKQTVDLMINLRHINLKKQDEKVDFYHTLPKGKGKDITICAFIGGESKEMAEKTKIDYILLDDFKNYSEKKKVVALAQKYDFFLAQANLMSAVATNFGKVLGVRGKMPNPKAGCVFPPKTNFEPLVAKLKTTIRIITKAQPTCQIAVGTTEMSAEDIAANIVSCYEAVLHHLPQEKNNLKNVKIKLTMSPSIDLGDTL
jgi:large subunit ribosomal protein L1